MQNKAFNAILAPKNQAGNKIWFKSLTKSSIFSEIGFLIIAFLAGVSLPFSFAPFDLWPFAIIAPAILLWLWQQPNLSPKQASMLGFSFGVGFFGFGVSWVFVSIHRFGGSNVVVSAFITLLFIFILSLFLALQGFILKKHFKGSKILFVLLGFPIAWVLGEWFRSVFLTGFPWLFLGYSQFNTPLLHFAPIGSVYLSSLAVVIVSSALFLLVDRQFKKIKLKILASVIIIMITGLGMILSKIHWTAPLGHLLSVSLVQANIPPLAKFDQKDLISAVKQSYGKLTEDLWGRDLILWPESAISLPLPYSISFIKELNQKALEHNSTLIAGTQVMLSEREIYNSLITMGHGRGTYHKQHLVPFGDFLPFENWLRGLIGFFDLPMSSFNSGPKDQDLLIAKEIKICPAICYEIAYPELLRHDLRDANLLVTLSEDGWFGDSMGPHQHLQIARMRAVELGRPVLRSTTSGITAVIDHQGTISAKIPQFQEMVLNSTVQPMQGQTPWQRFGIWPLLVILLFGFILPGRLKF